MPRTVATNRVADEELMFVTVMLTSMPTSHTTARNEGAVES